MISESKFDTNSFHITATFTYKSHLSKTDFIAILSQKENHKAEVRRRIKEAQGKDTFIQEILPFLRNIDFPKNEETVEKLKRFSLEDRYICFNGLSYIPEYGQLRIKIVEAVHYHISAGYFGQIKTFKLLMRNYWWPEC